MKATIREAITSRHAWLFLAVVYLTVGLLNVFTKGWTGGSIADLAFAAIFTLLWWALGADELEDDDAQDS